MNVKTSQKLFTYYDCHTIHLQVNIDLFYKLYKNKI
jgi:hypothetical protein